MAEESKAKEEFDLEFAALRQRVAELERMEADRKRTREALQRSEKEATRLAQENAVMAEIGRIISSTMNIEEVYERFAVEAHKLIPFDRIVVALNNPGEGIGAVTYALGLEPEGRRVGDVFPLAHSSNEQIMRTRASLLIQPEAVGNLGFTSAAVGDAVPDKGGYEP